MSSRIIFVARGSCAIVERNQLPGCPAVALSGSSGAWLSLAGLAALRIINAGRRGLSQGRATGLQKPVDADGIDVGIRKICCCSLLLSRAIDSGCSLVLFPPISVSVASEIVCSVPLSAKLFSRTVVFGQSVWRCYPRDNFSLT